MKKRIEKLPNRGPYSEVPEEVENKINELVEAVNKLQEKPIIAHTNPNCKDASRCKSHGETGEVKYEDQTFGMPGAKEASVAQAELNKIKDQPEECTCVKSGNLTCPVHTKVVDYSKDQPHQHEWTPYLTPEPLDGSQARCVIHTADIQYDYKLKIRLCQCGAFMGEPK